MDACTLQEATTVSQTCRPSNGNLGDLMLSFILVPAPGGISYLYVLGPENAQEVGKPAYKLSIPQNFPTIEYIPGNDGFILLYGYWAIIM